MQHQLAVYNDAPEDEVRRLQDAAHTMRLSKDEAFQSVVTKSRCLEGLQALNYLLHMIALFCQAWGFGLLTDSNNLEMR